MLGRRVSTKPTCDSHAPIFESVRIADCYFILLIFCWGIFAAFIFFCAEFVCRKSIGDFLIFFIITLTQILCSFSFILQYATFAKTSRKKCEPQKFLNSLFIDLQISISSSVTVDFSLFLDGLDHIDFGISYAHAELVKVFHRFCCRIEE